MLDRLDVVGWIKVTLLHKIGKSTTSVVGLGRHPAEGCSGGLTGGPRGAFLGDGTDPTTYRHLFNVNLLYIMIM